jgi:hypothetical protein
MSFWCSVVQSTDIVYVPFIYILLHIFLLRIIVSVSLPFTLVRFILTCFRHLEPHINGSCYIHSFLRVDSYLAVFISHLLKNFWQKQMTGSHLAHVGWSQTCDPPAWALQCWGYRCVTTCLAHYPLLLECCSNPIGDWLYLVTVPLFHTQWQLQMHFYFQPGWYTHLLIIKQFVASHNMICSSNDAFSLVICHYFLSPSLLFFLLFYFLGMFSFFLLVAISGMYS